jgi:hypothetical protein
MPRQSAAAAGFPNVSGAERLSPPSDLGPDERAVFVDLVAASRPEHFKASDLPLLCAYARAVTIENQSAKELASGDAKALPKWNGAVKALVSLSMRLRLSPQSRASNNPTRPGSRIERPLSVYETMALHHQEGEHDGSA